MLEAVLVFQSQSNPNLVGVYHEADSQDALKAFLENPDLKAAMGKAGVAGELKLRWFNRVEGFTPYE